MKQKSNTVVFFGSGPVAAKSLELLLKHTPVEHVYTKPKPAHVREEPPVISVCIDAKLPYSTVSNKQELSDIFKGTNHSSVLGLVIDFGIIITNDVIDSFKKGILNSHFSLLPEWRGADPITYSLLSGQHFTGVSLMSIVEKMDEGPLLVQAKVPISKEDNGKTLTNTLITLSDALLEKNINKYITNDINLVDQNGIATYSRKLNKTDGNILLHKPAVVLEREIRAFSEWPKSSTVLAGILCIITRAHSDQGIVSNEKLVITPDKKIALKTADGYLVVDALKPEGKKEMPVEAFLAGYKQRLSGSI